VRIEKLENKYIDAVYSIRESKSFSELLSRSSESLVLLIRLLYKSGFRMPRKLGIEITKFLYTGESEHLFNAVEMMRSYAVRVKFPRVDFYLQTFVTEIDITLKKERLAPRIEAQAL